MVTIRRRTVRRKASFRVRVKKPIVIKTSKATLIRRARSKARRKARTKAIALGLIKRPVKIEPVPKIKPKVIVEKAPPREPIPKGKFGKGPIPKRAGSIRSSSVQRGVRTRGERIAARAGRRVTASGRFTGSTR